MILIVCILIAALLFFFLGMGKLVDRNINRCEKAKAHDVSTEAKVLHERLLIADMHADTFLWDRDFLEQHEHGHIDLPRMQQGNQALQIFDAVTKTPRGLNYDSNDDRSDNITALVMANRWPPRTWNSLLQRAVYNAERAHDAANRSQGQFRIITDKTGLQTFLNERESNKRLAAGMLAVEGLHALEGNLENISVLYQAGYRMMGLVHFFDNEAGGSSTGVSKGGLTPFGQSCIRKMESLDMTVDLAHASIALIDDVLAFSSRPVVVSHTGVQGTVNSLRNLSDAHIKAVAARGGLIGIGYWGEAVGDISPSGIVKTIRYTADLAGVEHVALGSDYDGAVATKFDCSQLLLITDALLKAGFTESEITLIMGGNQLRFLVQNLPD